MNTVKGIENSSNKRKQLVFKQQIKATPYTKYIIEYLNFCNEQIESKLLNNKVTTNNSGEVGTPPLQLSLIFTEDDNNRFSHINYYVARWIRESLLAQYNNLSVLLENKQIYKVMERLIVHLIKKNITTNENTNKAIKSNTLLSPRKQLQQQQSILNSPLSPQTNAYKESLNQDNQWCPTRSYFVNVAELASRRANYASLDQSVPDELNYNFRLLIGRLTYSSNPVNKDRLVIKDHGGEVPVQLSSSSICIPDPNMLDSIVFVSSWRLVNIPSNIVDSSKTDEGFEYDSSRNIVNYIEIQRLHVLYRDNNNYFQRMLDGFYKQSEIKSQTTYLLQLYKPTQKSLQSIKSQISKDNNAISKYNINVTVLSKTSILSTKSGQCFFIQVSMSSSNFFIMFSNDMTKWFQLIEVGRIYLFVNASANIIFRGTDRERVLFHTYEDTIIYHLGNSTTDIRVTMDAKSIHDNQLSVLPHSIDYIGFITSDYNNKEGSYMLDDHRVIFTHYACKGFFGSGLRLGTKIKLENVHPIYIDKKFQGLGVCANSSFKFLSFVNNQTLINMQPFQSTIYYPLWNKYSIIDSLVLPKIFDKLHFKFPNQFKDFNYLQNNFKDGFLYDQIASAFGIDQVQSFQNSDDMYNTFFNHDHLCHYNKQSVQFPLIIELSQIPTRPKGVIKSDRFLNSLKYTLIGRLELEPQIYEWGKVYIKDDRSSSFIICNVIGLNEYHLNYIWKINVYMINFEVYNDEEGNSKTIHFLQFSMDDCKMLSPIDIQRHSPENVENMYNFYQDKFNQFQSNVNSISTLGFMFFKLAGKIIKYGKLSLSVVLLVPGLPLVKINNVPTKYYPSLQLDQYYYVDHCKEKSSKHLREFTKKITVDPEVNFKSVVFINSEETALTPSEYSLDTIVTYCIPLMKIHNDDLFNQIDRFKVTSKEYSVADLLGLDIHSFFKEQYSYISFTGFIVKHIIQSKNGKLSLNLWCRDIDDDTNENMICVVLHEYHYGVVEGLTVKFSNLKITTGGNNAKNFCFSNRYSYFNVLANAHERRSEGSSPMSDNFNLETKKNTTMEIDYIDVDSIGIDEKVQHPPRMKNSPASKFNTSSLETTTTTTTTTSTTASTTNSAKSHQEPISKDNGRSLTLSDLNRGSSSNEMFKIIADITSIISIELAYRCNNCSNRLIGAKCKCSHTKQNNEQVTFIGRIECEVSDGSALKQMMIKDEAMISKVLNISKGKMREIKSRLIEARKVGLWAKSHVKNTILGKYNRSDYLDLSSLDNVWDEYNHEWKTYKIIVKKGDSSGDYLVCNSIELVDNSEESWKMLDFANYTFNTMISS